MKRPCLHKIFGVIILNVFLLSGLYAQSMYSEYEVLTNDTLHSAPISGVSEIIVFHPHNGRLDLHKLSGDEFAFEYSPTQDFIGKDTFTIEYFTHYRGDIRYLHAIVTVSESFVHGGDDFVVLEKNSDYTFVDLLTNDSATEGEFHLRAFPYKEHVYVDVSNDLDSIFIKPEVNYAGSAKLVYQICDDKGACDKVNVNILIVDSDLEISSEVLHLQTTSNTPINFYMSDTTFNLVEQPSIGRVEKRHHGYMNTYTPFQNIEGVDTVIYDNGDVESIVIIEVIKPRQVNSYVVDDYFYTYPGDTIRFDVFENDVVRNGLLRTFSNPQQGELTHDNDGKFIYVAPKTSGVYNFVYKSCIFLNSCEIGNVQIYVGTLAPEGLYRYNLTTLKNRPFVINYDIPLSNFNFETTQQPQNGTITIYPGIDTLNIGCDAVVGYNLVTYTPENDFVGSDLFELEFCASELDICQTVKVSMEVVDIELDPASCDCVSNCVWPGDMNADGKVDMLDLLTFGWHLGDIGEERPFADKHSWHAQYSPDWKEKSVIGSDLKHLDSDGNGIIDQDDILAIAEFFNRRNDLAPENKPTIKDFPINLVYNGEPNPEIGDYVEFDIVLGNAEYPASFLYGLSLHYDVDPMVVDTSTLEMTFSRNSFLSYDAPITTLFVQEGRSIDGGFTRLDKLSPSGYGRIGTLGFVIEDEIDGVLTDKKLPVIVEMRNSYLMDGFGNMYGLKDAQYVLNVKTEDLTRKQKLSIFPNPAQAGQQVHARFNPVKSDAEISIYAMDGTLIHRDRVMSGTHSYEYHQPMKSGIYIMTIKENEAFASQKFIIGM